MHKGYLQSASLLAALSIAMGAFGAHALKEMVSNNAVSIFETGVRYQFYHVFALFIIAMLYKEFPNKFIINAGRFFIAGIILFSGSLYLLTLLQATVGDGYNWVGAITPVGGLCFIAGWIMLFIALKRR
ncbi:MAG: DUF423 domain-containing protein [Bacteroidetes bacterium]|nr:DUF423 domain-containing protein [Bacteroidota bacterium]MBS1756528.1 DUF423 domain-containing protein [Bacteroidota bacterium]